MYIWRAVTVYPWHTVRLRNSGGARDLFGFAPYIGDAGGRHLTPYWEGVFQGPALLFAASRPLYVFVASALFHCPTITGYNYIYM